MLRIRLVIMVLGRQAKVLRRVGRVLVKLRVLISWRLLLPGLGGGTRRRINSIQLRLQ